MQCYYNVHVSKNRGKFSYFPENHWVASSIICTFDPMSVEMPAKAMLLTTIHCLSSARPAKLNNTREPISYLVHNCNFYSL